MNRYILGGLLAFAMSLACTNDAVPTRPSSVPDLPPSSVASPPPSSTASTPSVEDPVADNGGGLNARWTIGDHRITVRVKNLSDSEQPVVFACYQAPRGVNELGDQKLDSHESQTLEPGEETRITLNLPACEWQCDVANRATPREPPFYTERELVGFRDSVQVGLDLPRVCAPPPPRRRHRRRHRRRRRRLAIPWSSARTLTRNAASSV